MRAFVLTHNTFALGMQYTPYWHVNATRLLVQEAAESLARQLEAITIEVSALTAQLASQHLKSHLSDSRKGALHPHHTTAVCRSVVTGTQVVPVNDNRF